MDNRARLSQIEVAIRDCRLGDTARWDRLSWLRYRVQLRVFDEDTVKRDEYLQRRAERMAELLIVDLPDSTCGVDRAEAVACSLADREIDEVPCPMKPEPPTPIDAPMERKMRDYDRGRHWDYFCESGELPNREGGGKEHDKQGWPKE